MEPLTEAQIRGSFVNCTKGEAKRAVLPRDLAETAWDDLDFLGWRDPQGSARAYLVLVRDGVLTGVVLRTGESTVGRKRSNMCSLCLTVRAGDVSLMVAPKAGKAGQRGHSVGTYICADLDCSLFVRDKRPLPTAVLRETLSIEGRVARLQVNLAEFVGRVLQPASGHSRTE